MNAQLPLWHQQAPPDFASQQQPLSLFDSELLPDSYEVQDWTDEDVCFIQNKMMKFMIKRLDDKRAGWRSQVDSFLWVLDEPDLSDFGFIACCKAKGVDSTAMRALLVGHRFKGLFKQLHATVIAEILNCLNDPKKSNRLRQSGRLWALSSSQKPFSFLSCCRHQNLEAETLRAEISSIWT